MKQDVIEKITRYYGYTYIIPCVCTFGILCNIVNLSVLTSGRLKESPYTYLTSLAWFDLLTLLFTLTTTFSRGAWNAAANDASPWPHTEFYLKRLERLFFLPSANLFSALSIAVTVVLTVERYLFIKFPMHAASFCTPSNARRVVAALVVLVFAFRLPMYFFSDAVRVYYENETVSSGGSEMATTATIANPKFKVAIIKKYEHVHQIYFLTSFLIFEIVPFILLFAFNLNLVLLVRSSAKDLESLQRSNPKSVHQNRNSSSPAIQVTVSERNGDNNGGGGDRSPESGTKIKMNLKSNNNSSNNHLNMPTFARSTRSLSYDQTNEGDDTPTTTHKNNNNNSNNNNYIQIRPDSTSLNSINSIHSATTQLAGGGVNSKTPMLGPRKKSPLLTTITTAAADAKIEKRKRDQYKLTRTLITVVFFVLLSEISSIVTYENIAKFLVASHFRHIDYMSTYYKLQVFVSNLIVLTVHSVNFFLYCAFNQKYLTIFKQKYSVVFDLMDKVRCKKKRINNSKSNTRCQTTQCV